MPDHIDLEALDRYFDSDLSPDDCMGLSDLDGFLTSVVLGPEPIMPSEWLPVIWGHEEPEFESTAHAERIIGLIMGRYNEIATGFNADPEKFEPIFWKRPTGEVVVTDWAAGFLECCRDTSSSMGTIVQSSQGQAPDRASRGPGQRW
jgi:uncharacterized protein